MSDTVTQDHYATLIAHLIQAFDELHSTVLRKVAESTYISPLSDYPTMAFRDNGFPYFTKQGSFQAARLNYVGTLRPSSIVAALLFKRDDELDLPQNDALESYVRESPFAHQFKVSGDFNGYRLARMIDGAVERYIQLHGLSERVKSKRATVLLPIFNAITYETYVLRLMVPIALTAFEFDHFRVNDSTYIARIPQGIQLARSMNRGVHSGATDGVLEAATHALVSCNWSIEPGGISELHYGLLYPGPAVLSTIDLFFASLRAATGADTGYAQIVMLPYRWATAFYADLPQVFGASIRKYPSAFDADYYKIGLSTVSLADMLEVKRIYNLIVPMENDRISIALKRLNACMTREDAVDAILDACIGLEVLLGKGAEAISHKIRMRAAALASLRPNSDPNAVLRQVKAIYDFRSKVVHGDTSQKRKGKKLDGVESSQFAEQRKLATDMLRFIVDVMVEHPRFLDDPEAIDSELLLGFFQPPLDMDEPNLPGVE
ncbi:hypothetical protein [Devosia sp.]|uniref:hypothetical protein n=1 Tax=Devosia sp. TaxID=1871048 RepID=UPI0032673FB2